MQQEPEPGPKAGPESSGLNPAPDLARQLTGPLPCASCKYDLRGLSVRAVCPECGTPVRATILARVDPYAGVLRPIAAPGITAAALVLWCTAAFAAVLCTWYLRAADAYAVFTGGPPMPMRPAVQVAVLCIVLSGVGALGLVRPHAGIPRWQVLAAAGAVAATWLLAAVYWRLHAVFDPSHLRPYFIADSADPTRTGLRLAISGLALAILLGLRPNARLLAARSLLLRMGRVDRQTMLGMVAAVGVTALGDIFHLAAAMGSGREGIIRTVGTAGDFLVAVGSMLLTVGMVGVVVDCWRIAPVLLRPPLSIAQIVGRETGA